MHLMRTRQQLLAFLLRHGRSYPTGKHWTMRHRSWLAGQTFSLLVHQLVFQDYVETVWPAQKRRDVLIERIDATMASWSLGHWLKLRAGIAVVSAPQLFLTPAPLAARMAKLADVAQDQKVLEPS